jgi:nitrogen fixation protein FixH
MKRSDALISKSSDVKGDTLMSPTTLPTARRDTGLQGYHVLYAFLTFLGVIFAVNGVMLYYALATHSGLVAQEPYRKGLAYNERISADERQAGLQWTADVVVSPHGTIAITLADASGKPVSGRFADATLGRAASSRHDQRLALYEEAPGRYVAVGGAIEPGAWVVDATVRGVDDTSAPVYRIRRRLWLKP